MITPDMRKDGQYPLWSLPVPGAGILDPLRSEGTSTDERNTQAV